MELMTSLYPVQQFKNALLILKAIFYKKTGDVNRKFKKYEKNKIKREICKSQLYQGFY